MRDVGEFDKRNDKFYLKFNRNKIIQDSVASNCPTIFDVGAHHGESISYLKELFPDSQIYSFEPDPDSFRILVENQGNKAKVFNLAISDGDGSASFYRNDISHTNSIYKVNLESNDSIRANEEREIDRSTYPDEINSEISVETITLDKFVRDYNVDCIDLLKIDVQGAEESVLKGGRGVLDRVGSIILEISFFDFYEKSTSFLDVEKILVPAGFKLFSILEVSRNPMNGRTDWAEVLYKRVA